MARFSALQRAEIAEIARAERDADGQCRFSALQRAEIAEMLDALEDELAPSCFSALQRAEIAEIQERSSTLGGGVTFQCSSTSRNC